MSQSVKHQILDLSSGHGLRVCEFKPHDRLCADSEEPAWDSVSPSLSACPPAYSLSLSLSLPLKINKETLKISKEKREIKGKEKMN